MVKRMADEQLYDTDFFIWTQEMARRLRERDTACLDWENIAEEIESMGKRDYRGLESRMEVLLAHLLKLRYQDKKRSTTPHRDVAGSWRRTIVEQRNRIKRIVRDSPSFRRRIIADLQDVYREAVLSAASQTRIPEKDFPAECPWTLESALEEPIEGVDSKDV